MPPLIVVGAPVPARTVSDEEMTFQTFRTYLVSFCVWTKSLYPHPDGVMAGIADAVNLRRFRRDPRLASKWTPALARVLRNAWATEILLNAPRTMRSPDLLSFTNLWAPVQAYYSVFSGLSVIAGFVQDPPPVTHAALLNWAASNARTSHSPFVTPWSARVSGIKGAWVHEGFGLPIDETLSNLSAPTVDHAPHLLALGLRTTRHTEAEEHARTRTPSWATRLDRERLEPHCVRPWKPRLEREAAEHWRTIRVASTIIHPKGEAA